MRIDLHSNGEHLTLTRNGVFLKNLDEDQLNATPVSYTELSSLVQNSQLTVGRWYRITDYTCTTTQVNTHSAGHQFDIIVMADSETTLNENAFAIEHIDVIKMDNGEGGSWLYKRYPQGDVDGRYAWVYVINGDDKDIDDEDVDYSDIEDTDLDYTDSPTPNIGYITIANVYHILDVGEPYFHKCNLEAWELKYTIDSSSDRFAWADSTNGKGVVYYMKDEWGNIAPFDFKNIQFLRDTTWFNSNQSWCESVLGDVPTNPMYFYFLSWVDENDDVQDLSIVGQTLMNGEDSYSGVYGNEIKETSAYEMGVIDIEDATSAAFALPCTIIVSGHSYGGEAFYGCHSNTFGNDCYSNSFGNNCSNNTFGSNCYSNTFGNNCYSNTFGKHSYYNTFGNDCIDSTFGNGLYRNTFGNYCQSVTVFDKVHYCNVTGGSPSSLVKNAQILNGTSGTNANNKLNIAFEANKDYTQIAALTDGSGTPQQRLKIWKATDFIKKSGDSGVNSFTMTTNETITLGRDPSQNLEAATKYYVDHSIEELPSPMIFKGSVGTGGTITWSQLPTASSANEGFTYKVITDHATAPICKAGDTIISNGTSWVVIPSGDEPSGTVTSVGISGDTVLSVSGSPITTSGTISITHNTSGATAGSYGDSSAQTPGYGGTFKVPYVTVNATGHVTGISEHTVTIPQTDNTPAGTTEIPIWIPATGNNANVPTAVTDLRATGNNIYAGTGTGQQCHMRYDTTVKCLDFVFD